MGVQVMGKLWPVGIVWFALGEVTGSKSLVTCPSWAKADVAMTKAAVAAERLKRILKCEKGVE